LIDQLRFDARSAAIEELTRGDAAVCYAGVGPPKYAGQKFRNLRGARSFVPCPVSLAGELHGVPRGDERNSEYRAACNDEHRRMPAKELRCAIRPDSFVCTDGKSLLIPTNIIHEPFNRRVSVRELHWRSRPRTRDLTPGLNRPAICRKVAPRRKSHHVLQRPSARICMSYFRLDFDLLHRES
jgi:hypothetical protein